MSIVQYSRAFDTDRINATHCKITPSDVKCDDFILQCPFSAVSNVSVWCGTHRFNEGNYAQKVKFSQIEHFWAKVQWKHWLFLCDTGEEWRIDDTRFRSNMDGKPQTHVPVFNKANSLGGNSLNVHFTASYWTGWWVIEAVRGKLCYCHRALV